MSQKTALTTDEIDYLFKLVIVGDSGVGKTSLLLKYVDDVFSETFIATIGVDFKIKTLEMDGRKIKLQIWDTAGQDRFRNIVSTFYRNANGILIVYDVTDMTSFQNIQHWLTEIDRYTGAQVKMMLVGNKCDLESRRQVAAAEAQAVAERAGMQHVETSAKTSDKVENVFTQMARDLTRQHEELKSLQPAAPSREKLGGPPVRNGLGPSCSC